MATYTTTQERSGFALPAERLIIIPQHAPHHQGFAPAEPHRVNSSEYTSYQGQDITLQFNLEGAQLHEQRQEQLRHNGLKRKLDNGSITIQFVPQATNAYKRPRVEFNHQQAETSSPAPEYTGQANGTTVINVTTPAAASNNGTPNQSRASTEVPNTPIVTVTTPAAAQETTSQTYADILSPLAPVITVSGGVARVDNERSSTATTHAQTHPISFSISNGTSQVNHERFSDAQATQAQTFPLTVSLSNGARANHENISTSAQTQTFPIAFSLSNGASQINERTYAASSQPAQAQSFPITFSLNNGASQVNERTHTSSSQTEASNTPVTFTLSGSLPIAPPPAPESTTPFPQTLKVRLGPMQWDKNTTGQVRTLIGMLPKSHNIDLGALRASHVPDSPYVVVSFGSTVDAATFLSNWGNAAPAYYKGVGATFEFH